MFSVGNIVVVFHFKLENLGKIERNALLFATFCSTLHWPCCLYDPLNKPGCFGLWLVVVGQD